jgi:hypothetical protein
MDSVDERYKPDYDLFLLKLVSSHLGVTLDRLGFTESKGLGATGQHERQAEVQDDSGVNPDAAMLTDLIMELSRNYLDCPLELMFEFTKDKAEDEAAKDALNAARRTRGAITQNEDRKSLGLTALAIPEADMPSMVTATGIVYIEGGADKQSALDEAAVKMAQNPPVPGAPPGPNGPAAGGNRGPGGGGPKPTRSPGPSSNRQAKSAQVGPEIRAYGRWYKSLGGKQAPRPFRFEAAEPDDVAGCGYELDGRFQAFAGYEWRQDITKDWRAWNAEHPLHPRGPHGRFVKIGNLVDELKRTHGELGEHHENALDEAVRRVHAGKPVKRGESKLTDDLEHRGLLEDMGRGKLGVSEAGRRHLMARTPEDYAEHAGGLPAEHVPAGAPEPVADPPGVIAARERQERIDTARQFADMAAEVDELVHNETEPAVIRRRVRAVANRYPDNADLGDLSKRIAEEGTLAGMATVARRAAEHRGVSVTNRPGDVVPFDRKVHDPIDDAREGDHVNVVRGGHEYADPATGETVRLQRAAVEKATSDEVANAPSAEVELDDVAKVRYETARQELIHMHALEQRTARERDPSFELTGYEPTDEEIRSRMEGKDRRAFGTPDMPLEGELEGDTSASSGPDIDPAEMAKLREFAERFGGAPAGTAPAIEDARRQGPADRLRQAEIMYGSDRSKWPAREQRDAARLERLAARKPKDESTAPIAVSEPTGHGQVKEISSTVDPMTATKPVKLPSTHEPPTSGRRRRADQQGEMTPAQMEERRARQAAAREESIRQTGQTPAQREISADLEGRRSDAAFEAATAPKPASPVVSARARDFTDVMDDIELRYPEIHREQRTPNAPSSFDTASIRERLATATSRESGAQAIDALGLTGPQLKQLAKDLDVPVKSRATKAEVRDAIVNLRVTRRLGNDAVLRVSGGSASGGSPRRSVAEMTSRHEALVAEAEDLDREINFAETDAERRRLERRRDEVDRRMSKLDTEITQARRMSGGEAVPKAETPAERARGAVHGQKALDAVPLALAGRNSGKVRGAPATWDAETADHVARSLDEYQGGSYFEINQHLRENAGVQIYTRDGTYVASGQVRDPGDTGWIEQTAAGLDVAMEHSRLSADAVMYRGTGNSAKVFGSAWNRDGDNTGLEWVDPAYTSTTADQRLTRQFAGADPVIMRVFAPAGTPAVRLTDMAPDSSTGRIAGDYEAEILLARGTRFRIIADHGYDSVRRVRDIDVEVVS